ncbi:MAG: hypoxanthine phosphoribosyltransferase [Chloroflexi bacterium]|nr:hypoxanthine phosphoribosyltransferase [Chloroflexota bacterium]
MEYLLEKLRILYTRELIKRTVESLAREIRRDYGGHNLILLGVLKGSFIFLADLARALDMPVEIDFVGLSSYGAGTQTSGRIKITHRLHTPIRGRDVLVVEDIVDTGLTTSFLLSHLARKRPSSLKLCTLLDKPSRRRVEVHIDYLGFTVPDKFIVGYGTDWDEKYRHLPDIRIVEGVKL